MSLKEIQTPAKMSSNVSASDKTPWRRRLTVFRVRHSLWARTMVYGYTASFLAFTGLWKRAYNESLPHHTGTVTSETKEQLEAGQRAYKEAGKNALVMYSPGGAFVVETQQLWIFNWLMRGFGVNLGLVKRKGLRQKFRRPKLNMWPIKDEPIRQQLPSGWAYDPSNPDVYTDDELNQDPSIVADLDAIKRGV